MRPDWQCSQFLVEAVMFGVSHLLVMSFCAFLHLPRNRRNTSRIPNGERISRERKCGDYFRTRRMAGVPPEPAKRKEPPKETNKGLKHGHWQVRGRCDAPPFLPPLAIPSFSSNRDLPAVSLPIWVRRGGKPRQTTPENGANSRPASQQG